MINATIPNYLRDKPEGIFSSNDVYVKCRMRTHSVIMLSVQ